MRTPKPVVFREGFQPASVGGWLGAFVWQSPGVLLGFRPLAWVLAVVGGRWS